MRIERARVIARGVSENRRVEFEKDRKKGGRSIVGSLEKRVTKQKCERLEENGRVKGD